jgi:hypothetical protein
LREEITADARLRKNVKTIFAAARRSKLHENRAAATWCADIPKRENSKRDL